MGPDGGSDTSIDRHHGTGRALAPGVDVARLDAELDRVVAGLRRGDLAFVVAAAVRLGPAIGVCLAAAGADLDGPDVGDVAFALADLAADPTTASWSAGELLAAAVADVAGVLGAPR